MQNSNSKKHKDFFKDHKDLEKDIQNFLNRYNSVFAQSSDQTHTLFEMSMLDGIIKYFEKNDFQIEVKNTVSKQFVYSLSTSTNPNKASYFLVFRTINDQSYYYEIRHNVKVRSFHSDKIFHSPDYVVCKQNALKSSLIDWYYNGKHPIHYVQSDDVVTFAEAKNYIPSPELVLNYIGIINELAPYLINKSILPKRFVFTPTMFISGNGNGHLLEIKKSLQQRYKINILFGMFSFPTQLHSENSEDNIESF